VFDANRHLTLCFRGEAHAFEHRRSRKSVGSFSFACVVEVKIPMGDVLPMLSGSEKQ
jgi:hypothetical protein